MSAANKMNSWTNIDIEEEFALPLNIKLDKQERLLRFARNDEFVLNKKSPDKSGLFNI